MIQTKEEDDTGNIVKAVSHVRSVMGDVRALCNLDDGSTGPHEQYPPRIS